MSTSQPTFDFITDESFRRTLELDFDEMERCAATEAWKAVHVLAGSIIESILVDYLLSTGNPSNVDPLEMTLAELIAACKKAGVLSQRTAELSAALKSYRNLIHPGRAVRLGERADADGAVVARSLVSIIVREVAEKQQQKYGLTAEQIATKFERDPTALGIANHLLRDASEPEVERLLLHVLPDRYFEEYEEEVGPDPNILDGHTKLFRAAFAVTSDDVKEKVTARFISVLKEDTGPRVQIYEEQFFEARDLQYVSSTKDRELAKAHLLSRLASDPNPRLFNAAAGLGAYLTTADADTFVDPLVRLAIRTSHEHAAPARKLLENEAIATHPDVDKAISSRIEAWASTFESRGDRRRTEMLREIKQAYDFADIPF